MAGQPIGLDIGTSAVRAAQVTPGKERPALMTFGQVALPPGAVIDGEIRDGGAVSEAISQLWKRAKMPTKDVIIGVANQRVVVRQIDVPQQDEGEFRASLRFQVADQIPMSVDDAELDFQVIGQFANPAGEPMMRILLVAAATDMIESFVGAVTTAGLRAAGVDLTPFAVARALSPIARGEMGLPGAEAIVDIGAGVTNLVVHHNGEPKFVRILLVGGNDTTTSLASELGISPEEAEAVKLDLGRGVGSPDAQRILLARVEAIVEEIRGSLDYYLSQEDSEQVVSIVLSGGGSMTPGLAQRLEQVMRQPIHRGAPLSQLDVSKSKLTNEQLAQLEPVTGAAVGLALGAGRK
ncbi:MAG TPA: type IV pilus assembly protein PilM [Actinomycetota bacterium]|nr:type IV pilus assembly protein PilM [Actinomycetota bacterium]